MIKSLDILAFGAHPDDVDACVGGTLAVSIKEGLKVGVIDLTSGDNSETGTGIIRVDEALKSAQVLGLTLRENLNFQERNFVSIESENKILLVIRKYKPKIVMLPYWDDRHKGHRDASNIIERAIQSAKYSKLLPETQPHKVSLILFYMMHYDFKPEFVFDISSTHDTKMKALYCHKSQIFKKDSKGRFTRELIDKEFIEAWTARSRWLGFASGFKYGEAFAMKRNPGIGSLKSLLNTYR